MKFIYIFLITGLISCKAQSPIIPLFDGGDFGQTDGAYYKDTNNVFEKFEGTWLWSNGTTILEIIIEKKQTIQNTFPVTNIVFYEDLVVGEYRYVEDGIELVNTLSNINDPTISPREHSISGNSILHKFAKPKCNNCTIEERRLRLNFYDATADQIPISLILRHIVVNGTEQLQARLIQDGTYVELNPTNPTHQRLPFGEYILIKQ